MGRYETEHHENTDYFRWHSVDPSYGEDGWERRSGEYRTLKSVKSGIVYDRRVMAKYHSKVHPVYTIQKLVAVPCLFVGITETDQGKFHDVSAKLVWEDYDG